MPVGEIPDYNCGDATLTAKVGLFYVLLHCLQYNIIFDKIVERVRYWNGTLQN